MIILALPNNRLLKLFGFSVTREPRIKYTFRNQVVEAIRISYELTKKAVDHEGLVGCTFHFFATEAFSPSHLVWMRLVL